MNDFSFFAKFEVEMKKGEYYAEHIHIQFNHRSKAS
ncbi:hypothetical protein MARI151_20817 [Maribacter litoralis]|uniref:Uncharacterized protein n=1 Tax=Maribacter litoralis TaxID=2059726 RepID=A0A653RB66_9FLAO|nr:hypothetical protein MARI151_20817 [Maribacter litoralis]